MNRNLKDVSVRLKVDPVRFPLLMKEGIEGRLETAGNLSNLPLTPSFIRRGNSERPLTYGAQTLRFVAPAARWRSIPLSITQPYASGSERHLEHKQTFSMLDYARILKRHFQNKVSRRDAGATNDGSLRSIRKRDDRIFTGGFS